MSFALLHCMGVVPLWAIRCHALALPDTILSVVPWDMHPISGRCVLCGHVLSCRAVQDTQTRSRVSCHANSYVLGWVCRNCCSLFPQRTPLNEQCILGYSCILSWGANWYVVVCPKLVTLRWRWNYGRIFFFLVIISIPINYNLSILCNNYRIHSPRKSYDCRRDDDVISIPSQ